MNKKVVQSLIFAGGLAVGALGTGAYFQNKHDENLLTPKQNVTTLYDNMFDKDFFGESHSPFIQMEKMRKDMDKFLKSSSGYSDNFFDEWYGSKFGGAIGDIKQTEDSKFVYYTIDLKGIDKNSITTDVSDGQVTISGSSSNIQAEEERGSGIRSESYESFHRSFPVPSNVDANKVEFETKGDQMVMKFPKVVI